MECNNNNLYQPYNRSILSVAQLNARNNKFLLNKENPSKASVQGKKNKALSYRSETSMVKKYIKWGFEAERQPLSGALKGRHKSDIRVKINGKWRFHEDKTRKESVAKPFYDKVANHALMYSEFCVMMNEIDFHNLLVNRKAPKFMVALDVKNKMLHGFFNQDNADIVTVRQTGAHESVFAVDIKFWYELLGKKV